MTKLMTLNLYFRNNIITILLMSCDLKSLLSIRGQNGCSRETCHWSRCRCHSNSTSFQVQLLLPWRWEWHSCEGVSLWSWKRRGRVERVESLLSLSPCLSSCPSRLLLSLSRSAGCWFPAEAASRYWWDWSPVQRTSSLLVSVLGLKDPTRKH